MHFTVDLDLCQDHGQCVFAEPAVFALDEQGRLAFRREARGTYTSGEVADGLRDGVEDAADMCPVQAIEVHE